MKQLLKTLQTWIVFGVLFWILDAALEAFVLQSRGFIEQLFSPTFNELLARLIVLSILLAASAYFTYIITKRAQAEAELRGVIESAPRAILIIDSDGKIMLINKQAEKMFGYSRDELTGKNFDVLIPARFRSEHISRCAGYLERPAIKTMGHEEQGVTCLRKDGHEFTAAIDLSSVKFIDIFGSRNLVINIVRDITESKKAREIVLLLLEIYKSISQTQTFNEALQTALAKVCQMTGWDYGESWIPNQDGSILRSSPAYFSLSKKLDEFRNYSSKITFRPNEGLPGRVWISQKFEWINDVSIEAEKVYFRAKIASDVGLKAGLGIPIISGNQVIAVLVFYLFDPRKEDERLVEIISAVAAQLGTIFQVKKTEELIRESEQRFRAVAETATDTIIIMDKDSKILFINDAVEHVFGYTKDELIEKSLTVLMPESFRQKHLLAVDRFLKTGERHFDWKNVQLPGLHKNGNEIPLEISYSEFVIDNEHYFTGIIRDISVRKKAEEKLVEEKNFTDDIINSLPGIFYLIDFEGRPLRWNNNAQVITGYTPEEVNTKKPTEFFAEDDRHLVEEKIKEAFLTGKSSAVASLLTKDGKKIPYFFTGSRIMRGNKPFVVGEALDISEQKQAEEAILRKDVEIRQAYIDVFSAVTGGKLIIMTRDELLAKLGTPLSDIVFIKSDAELSNARHTVKEKLEQNLPHFTKIDDLVIAASEAFTNSIKHAQGGEYRIYKKENEVQVLISDHGPGIDFSVLPKATLLSGFSTKKSLGMGFSFMLELCDRVFLSTQPGNTTLVLEINID